MEITGDYVHSINSSRSSTKRCIAGIQLPDFNDVHNYTNKRSGESDSEYEKEIIAQAIADQKRGVFQTESDGFNKLAKRYVSEVSPDREKIITNGLESLVKDIAKDMARDIQDEHLILLKLILGGEVKLKRDKMKTDYMEFYDSNGEMVAKYSNGKWTMLNTKAETARQIDMCMIYNKAWNDAAKLDKPENKKLIQSTYIVNKKSSFSVSA